MDRPVIGMLAALQVAVASGVQPLVTDDCGRSQGDEVVVCGSRSGESPYRLPKPSPEYEEKPLRAETDVIPGVRTRAHVQSEQMPDGNLAKRLMVTFSLPF